MYEDIQIDIRQAFNTDLLDATRTIKYVEMTSIYDEDTMENTITSNSTDVLAVKLKDQEGENLDKPSLNNTANFLIMDQDRIDSGLVFEIGVQIIDGTDTYKIEGINSDPLNASWELECRRWG